MLDAVGLNGGLDEHQTALGAGDGAADRDHVQIRIDLHAVQVLAGHLVAEMCIRDRYNTIYYKSSWRDAFESSRTREDVCTAANGAKQKTDFMHRTESGSYRKGDGYTAAPRSLNYGRMAFVLPEDVYQRQGR